MANDNVKHVGLRVFKFTYKYADIAKRDVLNVFGQFKDLRPSLDGYIFNDGVRKDLLNLDGTIPVNYKGNVYNIPICIWILDTHPYNPPMVYVKPTSTMQIRQGRNVDANGKIDLPYLRDWRYPQSDLLGLIQILVIVFSEEPPVFSRTQAPPTGGIRTPYPSHGSSNPPYPSSGGGFPMPTPGGVTGGGSNPAYPPPYSGGGSTGYPQQGYPQQGYGGYPQQQSGYPPQSGFSGYPSSTTSYPNASYPSQQTPYPYGTNPPQYSTTQSNTKYFDKTIVKILENRENNLNGEIEANISLLKEKDGEIKTALSKINNQDNIDIDEAVVTTTPLYRQLLNLFAEEQAIEDAIYYLGEALRKNVIDLDVFLKQVRELSRKQYILRATIQKCREKAGLQPLS
ncbi:hypothetical protein KUTeg_007708 [Tegillarca granosa]|uniref:Tumor susceptibility gene 101 protein n=1 Tax=Tegillarca granosa TaxID=220873 RepID=A0ABQ9FE04_TEGGR|nr:hypothetical protein KUTeg_007708 [Tegillarca granosa]